jgi:hypothetical protein
MAKRKKQVTEPEKKESEKVIDNKKEKQDADYAQHPKFGKFKQN